MPPTRCGITFDQLTTNPLATYRFNGRFPISQEVLDFSISSISGTISDGNTVTITGASFGTHSNTPIYYDDYRDATLGETADQSGLTSLGSDSNNPIVVNDQSLSGGKSLRMDYSPSLGGSAFPRKGIIVTGSPTTLYICSGSRFTRYTDDLAEQNPIMKRHRFGYGSFYSGVPRAYETDQYGNWATGTCGDGDRGIVDSNGTSYWQYETRNKDRVHDVWHITEWWVDLGDTDVANGAYWQRLDNTTNDNGTGIPLRVNGFTGGFEWIMSDFDGWDQYGVGGYYLWQDHIYADYTQARVMIGNNAVYSDCTEVYVQPKTSWSDTSIQIDFRGYGKTGTWYVFVIDSAGNATDGYEVTIL